MSIFDYASGAKEGKKFYHSHQFADDKQQDKVGSTSSTPFKKRQEIEKKRKALGAYKFSKIAQNIDGRREAAQANTEERELRKLQAAYGFSRPLPGVDVRALPTMVQYRSKSPKSKKKKRFSSFYMPKEIDEPKEQKGLNN